MIPTPTAAAPASPADLPSAELIARYSRPGPRYTSYPPVHYWSSSYDASAYARALGALGQRHRRGPERAPVSIYVHIPFCERRCTFCACNVVISRDHSREDAFVDRLVREVDLALAHIGPGRLPVVQMHWGGGTPTWLDAERLSRLADRLAERFDLLPDREQSIELDPRVTSADQLAALAERGLNRVSMGVQDFDPAVQRAIHRVQSVEQTARLMNAARSLGIGGVNLDLVYGLPHQTPHTFARTVQTVISLRPDRIALYNFAYLPEQIPRHRAIHADWLPDAPTRIELFRLAAAALGEAGYVMIGLDHFARAGDDLAEAWRRGTMQRNFMGYTTRAGHDLLAFGPSAIGRLGRDFVQNVKPTADYERLVGAGSLPVERGMTLDDDDLVRESVIQGLMCYGRVDFDHVERTHGVDLLADAAARRELDGLARDGLIEHDGRRLVVTPLGRYLLRNIAMVFDAYRRRPAPAPSMPAAGQTVQVRFSRTL